MENKLENLYTVAQVADHLNKSQKYVRDLINEGGITAHKVGREWRISESAIVAYLNNNINKKGEI